MNNSIELKEIPGFNGKYFITPDGNIWSTKKNRWLSKWFGGNGYYSVNLMSCDEVPKDKKYKVSRLVAATYLPFPMEYQNVVMHIDGNKLNNHYTNLKWCTKSEAILNACNLGLFPQASIENIERMNKAKLNK